MRARAPIGNFSTLMETPPSAPRLMDVRLLLLLLPARYRVWGPPTHGSGGWCWRAAMERINVHIVIDGWGGYPSRAIVSSHQTVKGGDLVLILFYFIYFFSFFLFILWPPLFFSFCLFRLLLYARLHWPGKLMTGRLQTYFLSTHTTVPGARLELLLHRTASVAGCCHAKALGSRNSKEHFPVPDFPPLSPFLFFSDFFFDLFFSVFLYFTWSLNSRHYSTVFLYQSV